MSELEVTVLDQSTKSRLKSPIVRTYFLVYIAWGNIGFFRGALENSVRYLWGKETVELSQRKVSTLVAYRDWLAVAVRENILHMGAETIMVETATPVFLQLARSALKAIWFSVQPLNDGPWGGSQLEEKSRLDVSVLKSIPQYRVLSIFEPCCWTLSIKERRGC